MATNSYIQQILINCSAVGYTLSMAIGGIFFAKQIRATGATTMIDPLKEKFQLNYRAKTVVLAL